MTHNYRGLTFKQSLRDTPVDLPDSATTPLPYRPNTSSKDSSILRQTANLRDSETNVPEKD